MGDGGGVGGGGTGVGVGGGDGVVVGGTAVDVGGGGGVVVGGTAVGVGGGGGVEVAVGSKSAAGVSPTETGESAGSGVDSPHAATINATARIPTSHNAATRRPSNFIVELTPPPDRIDRVVLRKSLRIRLTNKRGGYISMRFSPLRYASGSLENATRQPGPQK